MIKTEIKHQEAEETPDNTSVISDISRVQYGTIAGAFAAVLLGVVIYLLVSNSGGGSLNVSAANVGNQPALPLASSSTSKVKPSKANPSSDSQSSTEASSLSSSSFNLQNNVPSGQGSAQASPLQASGSTQSAAQNYGL